ncbi:MAG TPA: hypothetical protein VJ553_01765, partial [Candidatus Paceibacterota bacterium]|nr:hypothetical protein [Candidatus Paceibacterota bacterium]
NYFEKTFDDVADFGDNTDRVNFIMQSPTLGATSMMRYKPASGKTGKVNCLALSCDFGNLLISGAYAAVQNGTLIQVRFDSTIKFETKFNWTGLSGYIGGADDSGSENEVIIPGYEMEIATGTVIDVRFTGAVNVRRMVYIELHGTLDDGTVVRVAEKQAVDGTTATNVALYTVPAGRTLYWDCITISTRHIDLYASKGYIVYNGMPVMAFDIIQTDVGGVNGLVFPFWELPITEGNSFGLRVDSFECGEELLAAALYASEIVNCPGGSGAFRPVGSAVVRRIGR